MAQDEVMYKAALFTITAVLFLRRQEKPFLGIGEFTEESPGSTLEYADLLRKLRIPGSLQV
jgi:hypothetical protein